MTLWYVARGAGLSALVLLTISTALGALMSGRGAPADRVLGQCVHRSVASVGLAVLGMHLVTILADSYAHVGWVAALVPFTSRYRPLWVGLGTLAAYTFAGVAVVGFARGRIASSARGARSWRVLHGLAYAGWGLAMLHGLNAGSDTSQAWVRMLYLACATAVGLSVAVRIGMGSRSSALTPAVSR